MNTFIDKLAMSGYGGYVWTSFFSVLLMLCVLYFISRRRLKKAIALQEQLQKGKL